MEDLERHGKVGLAALRSGMHRNTARRYRDLGKAPSELREARSWRTREDPFVEDWPALKRPHLARLVALGAPRQQILEQHLRRQLRRLGQALRHRRPILHKRVLPPPPRPRPP